MSWLELLGRGGHTRITFQGYAETIFAYGQTGSGKSFTIIGSEGQPGILPLCTHSLFQRLERINAATGSSSATGAADPYRVEITATEVKDNQVIDLLHSDDLEAAGFGEGELEMDGHERIGVKGKICYYRRMAVFNAEETMELLQYAIDSREVGRSSLNSE